MLEDYLRYVASDSPVLAVALPHWGEAMLGCFAFEAKVRLLAGKFFRGESVKREIGDPKIRIIPTQWNERIRSDYSVKGYVYGQQKSLALFNCTGDWAFSSTARPKIFISTTAGLPFLPTGSGSWPPGCARAPCREWRR